MNHYPEKKSNTNSTPEAPEQLLATGETVMFDAKGKTEPEGVFVLHSTTSDSTPLERQSRNLEPGTPNPDRTETSVLDKTLPKLDHNGFSFGIQHNPYLVEEQIARIEGELATMTTTKPEIDSDAVITPAQAKKEQRAARKQTLGDRLKAAKNSLLK